jgi:S-adenosylmethionine-diacylgycerolhomoserine-N-methlytransferase
MRTPEGSTNVQATGEDAATHMDGIYKYQRYIYDITRKYFLLGRDHLVADLKPPPGGTVLEIGCGTGRNLIIAARKYPEARFYGFDISEAMLETARASIARAGLSDRITVAQGDATDFDVKTMFGLDHVDRAFCSYTLSMVPPWRAALPQAIACIGERGRFHIVDFGQQTRLPKWFRRVLYAWLAKFSVEPRADLENALHEAVSEVPGASMTFERILRDYAHYAVVTREPV